MVEKISMFIYLNCHINYKKFIVAIKFTKALGNGSFSSSNDLISVPVKTIPAVYESINSNENLAFLFNMFMDFFISIQN